MGEFTEEFVNDDEPDQDEMMAAFGITPTKRSNSVIGKVESCEKSKTGKSWRVKVSGKFYGAKFDSHLDGAVGKMIDFTTKNSDYGEWIESWAYSQAAQAPASAPQAPTGGSGRLSEPELRFVSNCVGQAITAKTIVSPDEIGVWTKAAAAAVREV